MNKVEFTYNGLKTTILCNSKDKMKDICNKFSSKIGIDFDSLYFLYCGDQIDENLTYIEQIDKDDKESNTMNILVYEKGSTYINKKIV